MQNKLDIISQSKLWDIQFGYWAVLILFVWLIAAFIWNFKDILSRVKALLPSKASVICLAAILVLFAVFAITQISLQHRVLSDETSWESMALEMRFDQSGGVCNQGVWKNGALECHDVVNNFKGKAFAFVQSLAFLVMEPNRDTALVLNLPIALCSLALLFFAMFRFTKDEWLALVAVIFLASQPIFLMQSRSASTEVLYVFLFAALLSFYSLIPPKEVSYKHLALIIPILGFFAQTRLETLFCFIPFALYFREYFFAKPIRLLAFAVLVLVASFPAINTIIAYQNYDFQGGEHSAHSFENFIFNVKSNFVVMWNELTPEGLLKNPFYRSYTVILLLSLGWLVFSIVKEKKYRWATVLGALFCLQIVVILLNVSGTFEIDINQRYVLVALPLFAIIMAVAICDSAAISKYKYSSLVAFIVCAVFAVYISVHHRESFNENILYNKNKLLAEEDFLNKELKKYPKNSIFIYARPWQMLASGFNGFSERQFSKWIPEELLKWREFSGDNIYIIRGQDGYGRVNKRSRVVGFKTTDNIETILSEYKTERKFSVTKPFGYALEAYKLGGKIEAVKKVIEVPQNAVLLQDLPIVNFEQSWGRPKKGKSVEDNNLQIDMRIFDFGIGTHANSKLLFNLNKAYKKFFSYIGLDDESAGGNGAIWVVKGDGMELYRSKVLSYHEFDSLSVDVEGVNLLELETLDNGDKDFDHTDWIGWFEP